MRPSGLLRALRGAVGAVLLLAGGCGDGDAPRSGEPAWDVPPLPSVLTMGGVHNQSPPEEWFQEEFAYRSVPL
jgi:hypothetical protein